MSAPSKSKVLIIAILTLAALLALLNDSFVEAASERIVIEQMLEKGEVEKAALLAKDAQKKGDPDAAEFLAMAGVAANKKGWDAASRRSFPEAIRYLELAYSLLPEDKTILSTLELVKKGQEKWKEVQRIAGDCEVCIAENRLTDAEKLILTIKDIEKSMGLPDEMNSSLITALTRRFAEAYRLENQRYSEYLNKLQILMEEKRWDEVSSSGREALKRQFMVSAIKQHIEHAQAMIGKQRDAYNEYLRIKDGFSKGEFQRNQEQRKKSAALLKEHMKLFYERDSRYYEIKSLAEKISEQPASTGTGTETAPPPQASQPASDGNKAEAARYFNRGLLKGKSGDHRGAVEDFTAAIRLDPYYTEAYFNRGFDRRETGDLQGAIEDYDKTIRLNPGHYKAYYNRGNIYSDRGDLGRAIQDYSESINRNGSYFWTYYNRAMCRFHQKDYRGAASDFSVFIENTPAHSDAFYNRGLCREMLGDIQGALLDYGKAVDINPGNAQAKAGIERLRKKYTQEHN